MSMIGGVPPGGKYLKNPIFSTENPIQGFLYVVTPTQMSYFIFRCMLCVSVKVLSLFKFASSCLCSTPVLVF